MNASISMAAAVIGVALFVAYAAWDIYKAFNVTEHQRLRNEGHRLMLAFCKNPTQRGYEAVWTFIRDNDISVTDLDESLVSRFNSLAGQKLDNDF
jgi:hypothetical protein